MNEAHRDFSLPEIGIQAGFVAQGQFFRIGGREGNDLFRQFPAEGSPERFRIMREICFVQEQDDGNAAPFQQTPEGAGVGLDSVRGADNQDCRVQHIQRALGFAGKIGVAGRVQQGQVRMIPGQAGFLGKDCNAPVLFHGIGIQKGIPVVHPPLPPDGAGEKQHGFGQGGFAGIHMRAESDDRSGRHNRFPPFLHVYVHRNITESLRQVRICRNLPVRSNGRIPKVVRTDSGGARLRDQERCGIIYWLEMRKDGRESREGHSRTS
uniref:Hypothetical elongation factor G n=1 Tax=uncultured microorganism TaxID=358574 RepID=I3PGB8_9ZZZZ|nr:hypothetical elongation factor G [uncultured microorganism]